MMHVSGPDEHGVVNVVARGTLTRDDYDRNLPGLAQLLEKRGPLPFLIVFDHLRGFELDALWQDLKFDVKYRDRIGRQAVVGDRRWQALCAGLVGPFFREELRYFDTAQIDDARAWIRG